jgi:hypothetical protein
LSAFSIRLTSTCSIMTASSFTSGITPGNAHVEAALRSCRASRVRHAADDLLDRVPVAFNVIAPVSRRAMSRMLFASVAMRCASS